MTKGRARLRTLGLLATAAALWLLAFSYGVAPSQAAPRAKVAVVTIAGSINPASADYLIQAIAHAERDWAAAVQIGRAHV